MKDKLIETIRSVPIAGKTYEEYVEALADRLIGDNENKCPYCHEDSEGYTIAYGAFWISHSVHKGWLLHAGKCKPQPINYCHICGRRLYKYASR